MLEHTHIKHVYLVYQVFYLNLINFKKRCNILKPVYLLVMINGEIIPFHFINKSPYHTTKYSHSQIASHGSFLNTVKLSIYLNVNFESIFLRMLNFNNLLNRVSRFNSTVVKFHDFY